MLIYSDVLYVFVCLLCVGDYAGFPGCGLLRLHSTYRHDLKIYASDEGRVQMTAAAFAKVLTCHSDKCFCVQVCVLCVQLCVLCVEMIFVTCLAGVAGAGGRADTHSGTDGEEC